MQSRETLEKQLGREPTMDEIAQGMALRCALVFQLNLKIF